MSITSEINKGKFHSLFPMLDNVFWNEVNIDEGFRAKPYLNPKDPEDQAILAPVYTYGGFREDRSNIWKGFEPVDTMIHLGIDIQVPRGTLVASITSGEIVDIFFDKTKFNGWGTKIIVKSNDKKYGDVHILYGHLTNPRVKTSAVVKAGDILAEIAPPETNGGWFEHLHLQIMDSSLNTSIYEIDGYEFKKDSIKGIIDPMEFLTHLNS